MPRIVLALSIACASLFYLAHMNRAVIAREEAGVKIPAKLMARHHQYPGCLKLNHPNMPPEGAVFHARLTHGAEIYGILCEPSAYNWAYAVYLVRDGELAEAERLFFADYQQSSGWTGTDVLFNAYYDRRSRELRGFSKARGLGDCGSLTKLKWDGEVFNLMEFRYKEDCDGQVEKPFPLIYKRQFSR